MKQSLWRLTACLAGALIHTAAADATTITTTTWTTWDSAAYISSAPAELNFTGITSNEPQSVTLKPLTGNTSLSFVFTGSTNLIGVSHPYQGLAAPSITISMPAGGEDAIWLDLGTYQDSGSLTLSLTFSDGEQFLVPTSPCCTQYGTYSHGTFGFALSQPITSLTVTAPSGDAIVDDFFFAQSAIENLGAGSSAPEAATLLLVGGGMLMLFGAIRRFRNCSELSSSS